MSDELKVEYTVKEIVTLIGGKIDNLDEKFDKFAENMNTRITTIETIQAEQKDSSKDKLARYGVGLAGSGVILDAVLHFLKLK